MLTPIQERLSATSQTITIRPEAQSSSNSQSYFGLEEKSFLTPPTAEFDPCSNAKPYSPFYNHDSPRASTEQLQTKKSLNIQVRDLEAQNTLTPTISREKNSPDGKVMVWPGSKFGFGRQKRQRSMCKTKPRRCDWMAGLSTKQRFMVKFLIALVIAGAMIGIGVGITARVHGGVWRSNNTTTQIGDDD